MRVRVWMYEKLYESDSLIRTRRYYFFLFKARTNSRRVEKPCPPADNRCFIFFIHYNLNRRSAFTLWSERERTRMSATPNDFGRDVREVSRPKWHKKLKYSVHILKTHLEQFATKLSQLGTQYLNHNQNFNFRGGGHFHIAPQHCQIQFKMVTITCNLFATNWKVYFRICHFTLWPQSKFSWWGYHTKVHYV